jgi:hypothetical protein
MLHAELDARAIEDARVALATRLRADRNAIVLAEVSRAIAPAAPSLVWPLGTPESIERVRVEGVALTLERARVGRRVRVAVLGPLPVAITRRFVASALAPLAPGEAPAVASPGRARRGPVALDTEDSFLVAAARLPPGPASEARAYADAYADALRAAGFRVDLAAGGGGRWGRWVAVRIDGTRPTIPEMARAARGIRPTAERLQYHAVERRRARRWAESGPGAFAAMVVADTASTGEPAQGPLEPSALVLLVGRDQPDTAYERLQDAR